jgi:predicted DNA-binding ArsR family transcriptional regulator
MADKAAIIRYKWLTKKELCAKPGCQSSNDQLHMADKAAMISYTWLTMRELSATHG